MHAAQRLVNHVALVLDASASMGMHEKRVPEVADQLIRDLALASEDKRQETRATVYLFGEETVECLVFDMDVMRLPSIKDLYHVLHENTALIDATLISQHDLASTSTIYGEHAFLTYVITDGDENRSFRYGYGKNRVLADALRSGSLAAADTFARSATRRMANDRRDPARTLANSTIAWVVPDRSGRAYVERLGAPTGNVIEWNVNDTNALLDVGQQIKAATMTFMDNRTKGVLRSANVFGTGEENVNAQTVGQAVAAKALTPIDPSNFVIIENTTGIRAEMADLARSHNYKYVNGTCYYGFWKTENVQPQKSIIIRRRSTGEVYTDATPSSPAVRAMIGLGTHHTEKVPASANAEFEVFIQSTAANRKIIPGRTALIMNPIPLKVPASV